MLGLIFNIADIEMELKIHPHKTVSREIDAYRIVFTTPRRSFSEAFKRSIGKLSDSMSPPV